MSVEIKCAACGRVLTPFDTRVQDSGKSYCPVCYHKNAINEESRKTAEKKVTFNRISPNGSTLSGFMNQRGTTVVREPENLFECGNCGYVVTRDRLREDARGRYACPKCGKKKMAPMVPVPEKAKPEKTRPGKDDFAVTAQLFKCLGDPCRVKIIESLSEKELCVFEFVDLTGFQYSAISYHLKMLKELGIVQSYERGNFVVYSLTDKGQIVHEFISRSIELK